MWPQFLWCIWSSIVGLQRPLSALADLRCPAGPQYGPLVRMWLRLALSWVYRDSELRPPCLGDHTIYFEKLPNYFLSMAVGCMYIYLYIIYIHRYMHTDALAQIRIDTPCRLPVSGNEANSDSTSHGWPVSSVSIKGSRVICRMDTGFYILDTL